MNTTFATTPKNVSSRPAFTVQPLPNVRSIRGTTSSLMTLAEAIEEEADAVKKVRRTHSRQHGEEYDQ